MKLLNWCVALLLVVGTSAGATVKKKKVGWNARYSLFYSTERFPDGLLDASGTCVLTSEQKASCLCAWDLHEVILTRNTWHHVLHIKTAVLLKKKGFAHFVRLLRGYAAAAKQMQKEQRNRGLHDCRHTNFYYLFVEDSFPDDPSLIAAMVGRLLHLRRLVNKQVTNIVQRLEQRGVCTAIFSNVGVTEAAKIAAICTTPHKTDPKKHHLFCADMLAREQNFFVRASTFFARKPYCHAYELFFEQNPGNYKLRIFVDDRAENLKAAVRYGFDIGILMTDARSLERSLQALGLLG